MAQNENLATPEHAVAITQGAEHNANTASQEAEIGQGLVSTANNAAAISTLIPLQRVLHTIVGLIWT